MHEAMVAESLLTVISKEAAKQDAKPIAAKVSCGSLNAINEEVLCFAFEAISKGTICEDVKLEVETKSLQARCKKCTRSFEFELCRPKCPGCGSGEFELLGDAPLVLETIEFETE